MADTETADADTIQVSRLAYEMAQFELHYLRTLVGNRWVDDVLRGRHAKVARQEYSAALARALRDPEFRRQCSRPVSSC